MIFFLQILPATINEEVVIQQQESLWSLLAQGGLIMIPLGILSFVAIYVFIERWLYIRAALKGSYNFTKSVIDAMTENQIDHAKTLCKTEDKPISRLLLKGIDQYNKFPEALEKSLTTKANFELYGLEKKVSMLSVIGYIAPLFGFLGTIIGMFALFYNIASTGEYTIATIAGGIYIKMISSAVGLIIGLAAYIAYRILESLINEIENRMEQCIAEFVELSYRAHP